MTFIKLKYKKNIFLIFFLLFSSAILILLLAHFLFFRFFFTIYEKNDFQIPWSENLKISKPSMQIQSTGENAALGVQLPANPYPMVEFTLRVSEANTKKMNEFLLFYIPESEGDNQFNPKWKMLPIIVETGQMVDFVWSIGTRAIAERVLIKIPNNVSLTLHSVKIKYQREIPVGLKWTFLSFCFLSFGIFLFKLLRKAFLNNERPYRKQFVSLIFVIFICCIKLWLVQGLPLAARGDHNYDDALFIELAHHIIHGDWLGPYHSRTLIKGPVYPLWIAFTFYLGIPLLLAQHLLYIGACMLFFIAIYPKDSKSYILIAFGFCLLVFNPATYSTELLRVVRDGIYPSLMILVISCLMGMYTYRRYSANILGLWAIGTGISFSLFWMTREEGVWLLPSFLFWIGIILWDIYSSKMERWQFQMFLVLAVPLLIWGAIGWSVSYINYYKYGIFGIVEIKTPEFRKAYGALTRIEQKSFKQFLPVPKSTREKVYAVSPSFAELEPYLEGKVGKAWAKQSSLLLYSVPNEIAGGWFIWAFRNSVAMAGYHANGPLALMYYNKLSQEINSACEKKLISCGPERKTLTPPWRWEYIHFFEYGIPAKIVKSIHFSPIEIGIIPNTGKGQMLSLFKELTGSPLDLSENPVKIAINKRKLELLKRINKLYGLIMPLLIYFSLFFFSVDLVKRIYQRRFTFYVYCASGILTGVVIRLALLSYIDITSFPGFTSQYLASVYSLLILFIIIYLINLPHLYNCISSKISSWRMNFLFNHYLAKQIRQKAQCENNNGDQNTAYS